MSTYKDANLDYLRFVVVASVMEDFKINPGKIIANEMHESVCKIATSLTFSFFVTMICRLEKVTYSKWDI